MQIFNYAAFGSVPDGMHHIHLLVPILRRTFSKTAHPSAIAFQPRICQECDNILKEITKLT